MEKKQLVSTVSAAQNGDNNALNNLFNEYYNDLYYFALKTVKDEETALDVTQEAFVEIINTLGNLKEPAAFVTWAKQITYHQCTRYFKKKKDVLVDEDEEGSTVFDTLKEDNAEFIPDEALDKADFKKTILEILDELSEEQRSAVMMYYFDELSVKQIAEIQGVSEGTVKSRLNYARKAIKASVEEYEKKNGIKLHALPFFPLFKWLFESSFEGGMPLASAELVAEGVTAATGTTVTVATTATVATATVATTATTTAAVGIGAKIVALPLTTKIIAGVVAVAITVSGGTTAVILSQKDNSEPTDNQSVVSSDTDGNNSSQDTTTSQIIDDSSSEDETSSDDASSDGASTDSSSETPTSSTTEETEMEYLERAMKQYAKALSASPYIESFTTPKLITPIGAATFLYGGGILEGTSNSMETVTLWANRIFGPLLGASRLKNLTADSPIGYNAENDTLDWTGNWESTANYTYKRAVKNSDGSYTVTMNFVDMDADQGSAGHGTKGVDWELINGEKYTVSKISTLNVSLIDGYWRINNISQTDNFEVYQAFNLQYLMEFHIYGDGKLKYSEIVYETYSKATGTATSHEDYATLKRKITEGQFVDYGVLKGEPVWRLFSVPKLKYTDAEGNIYITYDAACGSGAYGIHTVNEDGSYSVDWIDCSNDDMRFTSIFKSGDTLYIILNEKKYKLVPSSKNAVITPGQESDWVLS